MPELQTAYCLPASLWFETIFLVDQILWIQSCLTLFTQSFVHSIIFAPIYHFPTADKVWNLLILPLGSRSAVPIFIWKPLRSPVNLHFINKYFVQPLSSLFFSNFLFKVLSFVFLSFSNHNERPSQCFLCQLGPLQIIRRPSLRPKIPQPSRLINLNLKKLLP